jgi:hypothetical protein
VFEPVKARKHIADRIGKASLERHQGRVGYIPGFSAEPLSDQLLQLLRIEVKNTGEQAEDKDIFSLVLRRSAERFDSQPGDRNAHMNKLLLVWVGLDIVGIVEQDSTVPKKADMVLIAVLMEGHQEVSFVSRRENFAGSNAHLENRRTTRDGGRDRHVGHHLLRAAAGQPRQHRARRLNAVLRISGKPDHGIADTLRPQISPKSPNLGGRCVLQNRKKTHDKRVKLTIVPSAGCQRVHGRARESKCSACKPRDGRSTCV